MATLTKLSDEFLRQTPLNGYDRTRVQEIGFKRVNLITTLQKEGPGRQGGTEGGGKSKGNKDGRVKLEQPPYIPPSPGEILT